MNHLKAVVLSMLLGLSICSISAQAQTKLSLSLQNVTLQEAMKAIEKQTEYRFFYSSTSYDFKQKVSIQAENESLSKLLDNLLGTRSIAWKIEGNDIIILNQDLRKSMKEQTISGVVLDSDHLPLIGAGVMISGSNDGVVTDIDGRFSISVKLPVTLDFTYLGYESKKLEVKTAEELEIILMENSNMMEEIVVIAYGTTKKTDLTGSVSSVKMADIQESVALSVDQALQGRVAGADIMTTTGEPGATTSIRIRGTRSISASNAPLIVVDGVMDAVSDLNDINPADIASISVLKDASSTAIYGSRGSNGVIIITTKKGRSLSGKANINFKAEFGLASLPKKLDLMNATEYAKYRNDMFRFNNSETISDATPLSEYTYPDPYSKGIGTDWQDQIYRVAKTQNYNLSVSGNSDKSSYFFSMGYNDNEGIIQNSGIRRITGRLNIDYKLFDWMKVGYSGSLTSRNNDKNLANVGGTSTSSGAIYLSPLIKPTDNFNPDYDDGVAINTPRATIDLNTNNEKRESSNHTVFAEINILDGLMFRSQNSYYSMQRHVFRYYPSTLPKKTLGEGGEAYRYEQNSSSISSENTLTWNTKINKHKLDILGGFTAYQSGYNMLSLEGSGYLDDAVKWNNMAGVPDKNTYVADSDMSKVTKMSALARFNYNYDSRYYLTMTGRYDGASNFAANHKWGFFPSAALKWNIHKEDFMSGVSWIDNLSLRLSAGRSGNDAIAPYRSLEAMTVEPEGYLFAGQQPAAYYRGRISSPELTWEKTDLYNVALEGAFLDERIIVTAEAYISKTSDLLMDVQVNNATGFDSKFVNLGRTTNKGIELSIETHNIETRNFTWTTNFTISHNDQNVDDIGTAEYIASSSSAGTNPYMMHGLMKGYPVNSVWGFKYGGIWHNIDELKRNEYTRAYASSSTLLEDKYASTLGLPKYYDINRDGTLDQSDLVYLGNADPVISGGLQNNFNIGRFKLGMYITYSLGGKIYNYSEQFMAGGNRSNQYRYMTNSWHPIRNPESDYPRAGSIITSGVPSDRMVYDASFLRLKTLSLGYTFDFSAKSKWIRDLTLSLNGDNLLLLKKYNGYDPDISSSGDSSTLRRVDIGAYPKSRTIIFSLQVRY